MQKERKPDIEQEIVDRLNKQGKSYLTVIQLRNELYESSLKHLGIDRKSPPPEVLKKLTLFLGGRLQSYRGSRERGDGRVVTTSYIGFNMTPEELVLSKIRRRQRISLKQLLADFPMYKKDCLAVINGLLKSGAIECSFNEYATPAFSASEKDQREKTKQTAVDLPSAADERAAFRAAYDKVGRGRSFVRIHRIREYLGWTREHFDRVMADLMAAYVVEPHGGDPSSMSEEEIRNSYEDQRGILYITMTWRG